jgi:GT2 family glycosyltransferase
VVDNASIDDSVNFNGSNYPEVRIIQLDKNYGFSKGNNEGIKVARGEYIALLNNDTEVDSNWLEALNNALDKNPDVGFCASKSIFYNNRKFIDSAGDAFTTAGVSQKIGFLKIDGPEYSVSKYVFGASASSAIYRRRMFEKVGLFDVDFFHGQEDVDISFRAQLQGFKCLYVPEAIIYHVVSASSNPNSNIYIQESQRNIEYVWFKNMPSRLLMKYFLHHIFFTLGALFYFLIRGKI